MGKRELGPFPGQLCAHLADVQQHGNVRLHRFALHPIPIARPGSGRAAGTLTCGSCRQQLHYKVLSLTGTRVRRAVWLTVALAGAVAAVVFGFRCFAVGGEVLEEGKENPLDTLIPLFVAGVVAAAVAGNRWWHEDGVRGPGRLFRGGRHSLRWPNS